MTGWRIGYVASSNKALIKAISIIQSQSTSGASSPPAVIEQQPAPSVKQAPVPSITLEEAQPPKHAAQSSQRAEVQKIALAPALVIASDADNTSHEPRLQTPSSENGPAACVHHRSGPTFHEGFKFWGCCPQVRQAMVLLNNAPLPCLCLCHFEDTMYGV